LPHGKERKDAKMVGLMAKAIVFLLPMLVLIISCSSQTQSTTSILKGWGLVIEDSNFQLKEVYGKEGGSAPHKIVAAKNDQLLRIEKISLSNVENITRFTNDKKQVIDALYYSIPATYPGQITRVIECSKEFWPEYHRVTTELEYYVLYATPRLTYGACSKDLIGYRSLLIFFACHNDLFQIELFVPINKFNTTVTDFVHTLACSY
jgi:hypothetical protein